MEMIHLRKGETDLVIFCESAVLERSGADFQNYVDDGFKEIGVFSLTLEQGEHDLPYVIENL